MSLTGGRPIQHITTPYDAEVYLSASWRNELGQDAAWLLVKELDQARIRAVGDIHVPNWDESRVRRVMTSCSGYAAVLPYRTPKTIDDGIPPTAARILDEMKLALDIQGPCLILYDSRIGLKVVEDVAKQTVALQYNSLVILTLQKHLLYGPFKYDPGEVLHRQSHEWTGQLENFVEQLHTQSARLTPYTFLINSLNSSFDQARQAIRSAVEHKTGMPCVWADDPRLGIGMRDVQRSTNELIASATLVIADISRLPDSPEFDSPNRAFELGIAEAFKKDILLCAQGPSRSPFFAINRDQVIFWDDEQVLHETITQWIEAREERYSRRVFNEELQHRDQTYLPKVVVSADFRYDSTKRYIAGNTNQLNPAERWIFAASFALIAFALTMLLKEFVQFDSTIDFAALVVTLSTFVFASDLNFTVKRLLRESTVVRVTVPILAIGLFIAWIVFTFLQPNPSPLQP